MMLEGFLAGIQSSSVHDVPALLDAGWHDIAEWTQALYWMPNEAPLEIIGFGPQPVEAGRPFNVQSDGSSAVWVRASRHIRFGAQILLGGRRPRAPRCAGLWPPLRSPRRWSCAPESIRSFWSEATARRGQTRWSLKSPRPAGREPRQAPR